MRLAFQCKRCAPSNLGLIVFPFSQDVLVAPNFACQDLTIDKKQKETIRGKEEDA